MSVATVGCQLAVPAGKVKWIYYYDLALTLLGMYQEMTFTDKRDNCVPACTAALLTGTKI